MVGVIAIIAVQILKSSVEGSPPQEGADSVTVAIVSLSESGPAAVLYILALATLYKFNNKYTALLLLGAGAIAGQFLFV